MFGANSRDAQGRMVMDEIDICINNPTILYYIILYLDKYLSKSFETLKTKTKRHYAKGIRKKLVVIVIYRSWVTSIDITK